MQKDNKMMDGPVDPAEFLLIHVLRLRVELEYMKGIPLLTWRMSAAARESNEIVCKDQK